MKVLFSIVTLIFLNYTQAQADFYTVLKKNNLEEIEKKINQLATNKESSVNNAYLGTLLMKKSDFLKDLKTKIATFKKGHQLLEKEISENQSNTEYRFLRLAIQENAPKILKYNTNIEEDALFITKNYYKLNKGLKIIILEYSKQSILLNIQ
ncbi:MAG: hypothetical protein ACPG4Y_02960 [Chitinophagales bacterium]